MSTFFQVLALVTLIYTIFMIIRMLFSWVLFLAPQWRPSGPVLVLVESVYTITDPPLKAVGAVVKPVRIGRMMFDLAFLIVLILLFLLQEGFTMAARALL